MIALKLCNLMTMLDRFVIWSMFWERKRLKAELTPLMGSSRCMFKNYISPCCTIKHFWNSLHVSLAKFQPMSNSFCGESRSKCSTWKSFLRFEIQQIFECHFSRQLIFSASSLFNTSEKITHHSDAITSSFWKCFFFIGKYLKVITILWTLNIFSNLLIFALGY